MKLQILNIAFSILLLPINVCCAFWLFREALNLADMTFSQFVKENNPKMIHVRVGRHRHRKLKRLLVEFFNESSREPQKSIRLTQLFALSTLFGFAALSLAAYCAISVNNLKIAFIGNLVLLAINVALLFCGKLYRKSRSVNIEFVEQNKASGKSSVKNIVVYSLIGLLFFSFLLFFMMGISSISRSNQNQTSYKSAILIQSDLITVLNEKGYETANVPTTYWDIDENKLEHIASGVKGDSKFEFYGYSDNETVDLVYNQIVYRTAPKFDNSEREKHETVLSDGNRMFTAVIDSVYYLVMYRNDTVVYAYSPDSLKEIKEILEQIGYLKTDSK